MEANTKHKYVIQITLHFNVRTSYRNMKLLYNLRTVGDEDRSV